MIFLKVIELHSQIQETESRLVFETERDSIQELDVYQITGMSVGAARHGLPLDWQIKLNTIVMTQRQEAATAGLPLLSASTLLPLDTCGVSVLCKNGNPANIGVLRPCLSAKNSSRKMAPPEFAFQIFETAFNWHYLIHISNLSYNGMEKVDF